MGKLLIGIVIGAAATIVGGVASVLAYGLWFIHKHGYDGQAGWGEHKPKHWWQGA